jgi:predicted nucleic acid-binding protein
MAGVKRQISKAEERFFNNFFATVEILNFDRAAAEEASLISTKLLQQAPR